MKILISNISKSFGDKPIISDLNLEISDIQSLVFVGPSGAGKSTLLRILAGLITPDKGEITVDDKKINFDDEDELRKYRQSIGIVFQSYNLFSHLSALENLLIPMTKVHGLSRDIAKEIAVDLMGKFGLSDSLNKMPSALSGGQKQRVALIRAISMKPKFLLLDEPTSALDPVYTAEVLDTILEMKDEGMDTILVTHQLNFAKKVAQKVVFLGEDNLVLNGSVDEMLTSPKHKVLQKFVSLQY